MCPQAFAAQTANIKQQPPTAFSRSFAKEVQSQDCSAFDAAAHHTQECAFNGQQVCSSASADACAANNQLPPTSHKHRFDFQSTGLHNKTTTDSPADVCSERLFNCVLSNAVCVHCSPSVLVTQLAQSRNCVLFTYQQEFHIARQLCVLPVFLAKTGLSATLIQRGTLPSAIQHSSRPGIYAKGFCRPSQGTEQQQQSRTEGDALSLPVTKSGATSLHVPNSIPCYNKARLSCQQ